MLSRVKKIVESLLAWPIIQRSVYVTRRVVLEVFGGNRLLSIPYSILMFGTFNREQYAVLRGRRNYYRQLNSPERSSTALRRNIHRIEKGMSMNPRRPVFAEAYIKQTVDTYCRLANKWRAEPKSVDEGELHWAHDVLKEFFSVAENSPRIADAREKFELQEFAAEVTRPKILLRSRERAEAPVSYDDFLKLSRRRRSVRWFEDKPVPRELLDKALNVARESPTACNRLPYKYIVFNEPELARKIASIPFGAAGYSQQVPAVVVVVGKLDSYFSARDRHAIYIDSSLSVMSFILALETLGLSSSVINWPDFEPLELKMQRTLRLDASERVIMLIAVGYPLAEGLIPRSEKKSLSSIREYNPLPR